MKNSHSTKSALVRRLGLLLLAASVLSSCAFWKNFSTYFNVLYLAQKHLELYEETVDKPQVSTNGSVAVQSHRWLDEEYEARLSGVREGNPVALPATFSHALANTKQVNNIHLDSAIILGSKILAQRKDTKYVEDALYIVGKAQYYKNDFGGAKRKFLELLTRYPNTKYGATVQVLLSQSMLANHQLDTAKAALNLAMQQAEQQGDKHVVSDVHRAWAEYIYAKNLDSLAAIADELRKAEAGLSGDDLASMATEEGIVDYMNADWATAEHAFGIAAEAAHDPWLGGEAHIDHALTLRRLGKYDAAAVELTAVVGREKFSSNAPAARFELAKTNEMAARAKVAGDLKMPEFRTQLMPPLIDAYYTLDTMYKNTSALIMSRAKYQEAELYREVGEYDSAAKFAGALIGTKDFSTPAMNQLVNERMRSLAQFSKWRAELGKLDSIESAIRPRKSFRNDDAQLRMKALQEVLGPRWSPESTPVLTAEDSVHLQQVLTRMQKERATAPKLVIADTVRFLDSLHFIGSSAHFEIGRAYETFGEVPKARDEYRSALAYHFVIPDTGKDALHARELYSWIQLEQKEKNKPVADSLLTELLTYYGQTMYAEQARRFYAVQKSDSRGESAYAGAYRTLKVAGLTSAKAQFLDVVLGYGKEDVAPRSLYALGLTYEESQQYDSALTYYRWILHDYPYSSYAVDLRNRMPDIADANTRSAARRVDPNTPIAPQQTEPGAVEEQQRQELERSSKMREEQLRREQQQQQPPGLEQPSDDMPVQPTQVPPTLPPGQGPRVPLQPGQKPPQVPPPPQPPKQQ